MAVLLITYDLNREGGRRPPIVEAIQKIGTSYRQLSESSYAVETGKSPASVYDELDHLIDANDRLYIITLRNPWRSWGSEEVNRWLEARLD